MQKIKILKQTLLANRTPEGPTEVCMLNTVCYTDRPRARYLAATGDVELVDDEDEQPTPTPAPAPAPEPVADTIEPGEGIDLV